MPSLSIHAGGLQLNNPILLAAGILGTTGASLCRAARAGAGGVVTKSVGSLPREGHPGPTIVHVDGGLLNAMGLPNPSYKDFQDEIDTARAGGVPVIASIFGSFSAEFAQIARSLKADAFELNLSCPHAEKYGSELGRYPDLVESVTGAVKAAADVPVWVKLTPNTADIIELGLAAQRGGADAIVAINTLKAMAIDIETGYPILGNCFGGLSRSGHQTCGRALVYELASRLEIPVIDVGGVYLGGCRGDDHGRSLGGAGRNGSSQGLRRLRGDHNRPVPLSGEKIADTGGAMRPGREETLMKPINCIMEEVRSEAPLIRTFRLDRNLDPAPGQYVMVWIRGVDEIPMSFSGPDTITVQSVGVASAALFSLGAGSSVGLRGPLGSGFILRGKKIRSSVAVWERHRWLFWASRPKRRESRSPPY